MGVYNVYAGVQLKVGENLDLTEYKIGDEVPLKNGIYIGYEGIIIIRNKKLVECYNFMWDKWGEIIKLEEILDRRNPANSTNILGD